MRSKASWMSNGKFGLMVHWIPPGPLPQYGEHITDLNTAVDRFDLDLFLRQFVETGADWLIFTLGQNTGRYIGPNRVLDRLAGPGRCSSRDLALEIAQAVKAMGRRFIAYFTYEVAGQSAEIKRAFQWTEEGGTAQEKFQPLFCEFIAEYAQRFGSLLDGWWIDGTFPGKAFGEKGLPLFDNTRIDAALLWSALRAGNPQACAAFNDGSFCCGYTNVVVPGQDYLAGETEVLINGKVRYGGRRGAPAPLLDIATHSPQPPASCLWHALVPIDCMWAHGNRGADWQCLPFTIPITKPGAMEPPLYSVSELETLVREFKTAGGGVTFNAGIFQEGGLGPGTVEQLAELAGCVRYERAKK